MTEAGPASLGLAMRLWLALILLVLSLRAMLDGPEEPAPDLFDIETARHNEAQRRLRMLGNLAGQDYNYSAFRERSRDSLIPMPLLKAWHEAYKTRGIGGLVPDWEPLSEGSRDSALRYRSLLGELADAESVSDEDIEQLAAKLEWRVPRTREWVVRYRRGGLWALAPEQYPYSDRVQQRESFADLPRMPGTLTEKDLDEVERRTVRLGWLLELLHVSDKDVNKRAKEVGCTSRTLWTDLSRHREYGPFGLTNFARKDRGGRHGDDWYNSIIIACRLSKKDASVNWIYEEVCRRARRRGLPEPTRWRVRSVCEQINRGVKAIADGREDEFRNSSRFAGRLKIDGVVYEIDHTQVDVLVCDLRSEKYRTKSGLVRPWLTLVIEAQSRAVLAAVFSYDQPDRFTVAEAIRRALIITDTHPYGGIPGEIWVDRGEDLVSRHVRLICIALHIKLHPTYCPEHKPHVERFFGTLNTELWSEQPGYTDSSVAKRNPTAERDASHVIATLEAKFWGFINTKYHVRDHSALGMSPLRFWDENCFTEAPDPRKLDVLMMEPEQRKITKGRISLDGRLYFHPELATIVGEHILVRRTTHYGPPDFIEVYKDGAWVCTAVALDSDLADDISAKEVREAQKAQRKSAREQIEAAKQALKEDDHEAGQQQARTSDPKNQTNDASQAEDGKSAEEGATSGSSDSAASTTSEGEQGSVPAGSAAQETGNVAKPQTGSFLQRLGRQVKDQRQEGESHE
jgi:putative transposase